MNASQHRVALAVAVIGLVGLVASAVIGRKDVPLPLGPGGPQPEPAHYALTVFAEDGCAWCLKLEAEMRKPEAEAALARFAVVEVRDRLKATLWGVHGYPCIVVTDAAGKELGRHEGYMDAHALAAWLDGFR